MKVTNISDRLDSLSNPLISSKYPNISYAGKFLESFNRAEHGNQRQRKYSSDSGNGTVYSRSTF